MNIDAGTIKVDRWAISLRSEFHKLPLREDTRGWALMWVEICILENVVTHAIHQVDVVVFENLLH